jgi:predicted nucleic acid-binding protein
MHVASLLIHQAYLALRDGDDEHHDEAVAILTRLARQRFRHYTSNIILYEAHALVLSTLGIAQGQSFLRDMEESNTALIRVR